MPKTINSLLAELDNYGPAFIIVSSAFSEDFNQLHLYMGN